MSAKRWADEYSSDEGSVDPEDEPVEKAQPAATKAKAPADKAPHQSSYNVVPPRQEVASLIAYVTVSGSSATRDDVGNFFQSKGCSIKNLDFTVFDNRPSTAIIEFRDPESMDICLRLNGEAFQGNPIRTQVFEPREKGQGRGPQGLAHGQGHLQGGRGGQQQHRGGEDRFSGRKTSGPPRDDSRGDARGDVRGDGRGGGRGGSGFSRDRHERSAPGPGPYPAKEAAAPAPPASRPKLVLQPRTLPVEIIGKTVADETKPDIFGGGRPHDELQYEVCCPVKSMRTLCVLTIFTCMYYIISKRRRKLPRARKRLPAGARRL